MVKTAIVGLLVATSILTAVARPRAVTKDRISHDFVESEITDVIKVLAEAMGRSVYIGPGVEGKVTISLRSVSPQGALAMVLAEAEEPIQYKFVGSKSLLVAPLESLKSYDCSPPKPNIPSNAKTREFRCGEMRRADVVHYLQSQVRNVEFFPGKAPDRFCAKGSEADLESIPALVAQLEGPEDKAALKMVREFVTVRQGDLPEIQELLKTLAPEVFTREAGGSERTLVLWGPRNAVEFAQELLGQLDVHLDQIVLDYKLVSLSPQQLEESSIVWEPVGRPADGPDVRSELRVGHLQRSKQSNLWSVAKSDSGILASPRVKAEGGKHGEIHIGDKLPVVRYDAKSGSFCTTYEDLGLKIFSASARLTDDGEVACNLRGEFALLEEMLSDKAPRIRALGFQNEFIVAEGETLVIDGLAPPELRRNAVAAVPLLRDLPVQGPLFAETKNTHLYLMVTPNVMK